MDQTNNHINSRDIELLFELGTLRHVKRGWQYLVPSHLQNLTEHTYRVLWTTYLLSKYTEVEVNELHSLKMALSYNLYRSRTGDPHYVALPNVELQKEKAIQAILRRTSLQAYTHLIHQYLNKSTPESQLVYTANGIENLLELNELIANGSEIAQIWLEQNYASFYAKVPLPIGQNIWLRLREVKPYAWHLLSADEFGFNQPSTSQQHPIDQMLNFMYEIGTLRFIKRTWGQFAGESIANVAEHTFRLIWLSLLLAHHQSNVNESKLILMAMLHDLPEIRSMDANYIQTEYVHRNKIHALENTLGWLENKNELMLIYQEFQDLQSIEAQIVHDADRLEPVLELQELKALGVKITQAWQELNHDQLIHHLHLDSSKEFLSQIIRANPHQWHLETQNRFKGEWA